MAHPQLYTTLGELADAQLEEDEDCETMRNIVEVVEKCYPAGWRDWKAVELSKEDIVGKKNDPIILNKLRYALPTVEMIRAVDPEVTYISEKSFKSLKLSLLELPFTRALIIYPVAVGTRIRGSAAQYEIFSNAIENVKEQLLSREDANRSLKGEVETIGRKRRSTSVESETISKSRRLDATEKTVAELSKRTQNIECLLHQILQNQQDNSHRLETETIIETSDEEAVESDIIVDSENEDNPLPELLQNKENYNFSFLPEVMETEPLIPEAQKEMVALGINCQRLGTSGWNRVRFSDAQKKLQATPVFTALKMNEQLKPKETKWISSDTLTKFENSMAVMSHGLLKQRVAFSKGVENVLKEVDAPNLKEVIQKYLTDDSTDFKTSSDNCLQFACGRRADVINSRRELIKTSSKHMDSILKEIVPSQTHLYDEEKLAEAFKNHGGFHKFFPNKPLHFQSQPQSQSQRAKPKPASSKSYVQRTQNFRRQQNAASSQNSSNRSQRRQERKPASKSKSRGGATRRF